MTRIVTSSAARLVAGIAAALALPATAMAWSVAVDAPTQRDARLASANGNDNGQFWVTDVGNFDWVTLLRYDANNRTSSVALRETGALYKVLATTEGDLIAVLHDGTHVGRCRIVKFAADGSRRWEQSFDEPCAFGPPYDVRAWQLGTAGFWVKMDNRFARLAPDGRILRALISETLPGTIETVDPNNGNFYVTTPLVDGKSSVVAFDRDGKELWRNAIGTRVRLAVADDGSLRALGAGPNLFLAAIGTNGQTQWKTDLGVTSPAPNADASELLAPVIDGKLTTVALKAADAAIRVDATGKVSWRVSAATLGVTDASTLWQARRAPNGDMLFIYGNRLIRVDAAGGLRFSREMPVPTQLVRTLSIQTFGTDASAVLMLATESGVGNKLQRVSVTGEDLASPATSRVVPQTAVATRVALPDGSIVAWTDSASGERELQRIDGEGKVLWRQATAGTWTRPIEAEVAGGALVAGDGRVCTLDGLKRDALLDHVLACYRTTDGSQIWSRRLHEGANDFGYTQARLHVATDGSISAWYDVGTGTTSAVEFARVDRDGNVLGKKTLPAGVLGDVSTINPPFAYTQNNADVIVYNADGSERYRYTQAKPATVYGAFDTDGAFFSVSWDALSSKSTVERYSAVGKLAWSKTLDSNQVPTAPVVIGDSLYVATCCSANSTQRKVVRLKSADGATVWQRDLPTLSGYVFDTAQLVATPLGDAVLAVSSSARTLDVDVLETQDGSVRTRHREACRSQNCISMQPLVAGERLHLFETGPAVSSLIGWKIQPARNGLVRLDQVGLTGAWWAPYANGEGFVLDYLPSSRTFFMPWFTFSREGGNDPSGQRWYVVQGSIAENATKAELPITRAVGGVFDAGPVVPGEIVGKAVVSFADCGNGTLEYTFNEGVNGATKGVISLSRLSPATTTCMLADGTTQPGSGTRPAANGFDSRMSGSWFEAATSGQGLEFVIQPNGLYFAPWFTFDPAGPSDDPDRQRWFTLQGSLENARNGVVEAPIVQGIGGAFDRVSTGNVSLVGTSKLTLSGCDKATLEYKFDDSELAGPMRKLAGSIDLIKIGGCAGQ